MRGWGGPDCWREDLYPHLLQRGGFWASLLDESGSSLRKRGVVPLKKTQPQLSDGSKQLTTEKVLRPAVHVLSFIENRYARKFLEKFWR